MPNDPFAAYTAILGAAHNRMMASVDPDRIIEQERLRYIMGLAPERGRRQASTELQALPRAQRQLRESLLPEIQAAEERWGLPQGLLDRLALQESSYNPRTNTKSGAAGLMQIMPDIHREELARLGLDPNNPTDALDFAGRYLSRLHGQFGSWDQALAAYNAGQGRVRGVGGDLGRLPSETQAFVRDILGDLQPADEETPAAILRLREVAGALVDLATMPADATQVAGSEPPVSRRPGPSPDEAVIQADAARAPGPVGGITMRDRREERRRVIDEFMSQGEGQPTVFDHPVFEPIREFNEAILGTPVGEALSRFGDIALSLGLEDPATYAGGPLIKIGGKLFDLAKITENIQRHPFMSRILPEVRPLIGQPLPNGEPFVPSLLNRSDTYGATLKSVSELANYKPVQYLPDTPNLQRARELGFEIQAFHGTDVAHDFLASPFQTFRPWSHFGSPRSAIDRLNAKAQYKYGPGLPRIEIYDPRVHHRGTPAQRVSFALNTYQIPENARVVPTVLRGNFIDSSDSGVQTAGRAIETLNSRGVLSKKQGDDLYKFWQRSWEDHLQLSQDHMASSDYALAMLGAEIERLFNVNGFRYVNNLEDSGSVSYVVFNPANVRSVFAKFDKAMSSASGIGLGIGGAAIGLSGGGEGAR